jgi:hypothetical protein
MKLVRLIKMCLNDICSKLRTGKYLSDALPIQNDLKQGDALSHCFSAVLEYAIKKSKRTKRVQKWMGYIIC